MTLNPETTIALAQETLGIEIAALQGLQARVGASFVDAVSRMLACRGRVVVMGMGKSGHVGRKIAATLASTGTAAMFVHPAEASHGDLGMLKAIDVVLAISYSGESEEITRILPALKRLGVPIVAMTGKADSSLALHADAVLDCTVDKEACPLNLRPPPALPRKWPWAMRWPWRSWMRVVSRLMILRAPTPAARWGASCLPMCVT